MATDNDEPCSKYSQFFISQYVISDEKWLMLCWIESNMMSWVYTVHTIIGIETSQNRSSFERQSLKCSAFNGIL